MPGSLHEDIHQVILSGPSAQARKLKTDVERAARTDRPVLIFGEPGTGKDSVAHVIHNFLAGKGRFVPFYIADSRDEDFEALLKRFRPGTTTAGNTLYLEDVADLSSASQRLLAAYLKGGGRMPKIIASTAQDLQSLVKYGAFSRDLFWELNVQPLSLPNLQHRKADIPVILRKLLRLESPGGRAPDVSEKAMMALVRYAWPGNVKELKNVVVRFRALGSRPRITRTDVQTVLANPLTPETGLGRGQNLSSAIYRNLEKYFKAHDGALPPDGVYERILREVERPLLSLALNATHGNQLRAAKLLGLNRNTLRKKMKNLDVRVKDLKS